MNKTSLPFVSTVLSLYLAVAISLPSAVYANGKNITFAFPEAGYPPYVMHGENGQHGVLYDIFEAVSGRLGYTISKLQLPEKRVTREQMTGNVDASPSALPWVEDPDKFVWTDPILITQDNLVFRKDAPISDINSDQLTGQSLTTIKDFRYPSLEPLFVDGKIQRIDTRSIKTMLKIVAMKRTRAGVLDRIVGKWTMRDSDLGFDKNLLEFSDEGFDPVGYRVRLTRTKDWGVFLKSFDSELKKFKKTDRYLEILSRYQ
jgi:polar amino acid transport system substrate-binding protein